MSLSGISHLTIDNTRNVIEIRMSDGTVHSEPTPHDHDGVFDRTTYVVDQRLLKVLTTSGDQFDLEIHDGTPMTDRTLGRTIVYLDQNKWIALAQWDHAPLRIPVAERSAVGEFARLTSEGRFIVPFSTGHMMETGSTGGKWRQDLAPVIARVSRGWMMADPLLIRRIELAMALDRNRFQDLAEGWEVFTLDPEWFDIGQRARLSIQNGMSMTLADQMGILSHVEAIFGVLLDGDRTASKAGEVATASWAAHNQDLAAILRDDTKRRSESRLFSLHHFLRDLRPELNFAASAAKMTITQINEWAELSAEAEIAELPYLGRLREVSHFKLRNASDPWKKNDLVDLTFLACAAGYADAVIGEKHTIGLLQRANNRLHRGGAGLHTTFSSFLTEVA